ncbi:condensation domain-containing protein, partial [Methylogaea oryzae]|uniref:condensation domain-containing protein n=1 Tax=Methylogaea oryzae TaxID=1295382 RepID=UPI0020D09F75
MAKQAGVPLKSLLLTAHVYALGRLTGHSDITTGLVANGRPETPGGEKTLGLFLNTVPFRHRLAAVPWLEGVRAVAAQERELLPQRRFPLAEMQRRHGGELFETAFNFIHFHVLKDAIADPALHVLRERGFARTNLPLAAEFSLDVNRNDAVTLRLSVHSDAIDDRQLATMADIYRR